jgi:hypothetical protein
MWDKIIPMKSILTLMAVSAMHFCLAQPEKAIGADFSETRLTDRVLVLQNAPWAETMTVIDAGSSLLVVDTWGSLAAAKKARIRIDGIFHKPVRYVINTHYHWDHTFGNAAFPGAEIVGHRTCAEDMTIDYGDVSARKRIFEGNVSETENASLRTYILNTGREASDSTFPLVLPTRFMERRGTLSDSQLLLPQHPLVTEASHAFGLCLEP